MKSVTDSGGFDSPPSLASLASPPLAPHQLKTQSETRGEDGGGLGLVGGLRRERGTKASVEWSGLAAAAAVTIFLKFTHCPLFHFFPLKSSLPLPFVSSLPLARPHLFSPCGKKTPGRRIYALRLSIPLACPEDSHKPPPLSVTITPKSSLWLLADVWNPPNFVNRLMQ